MFIRMLVRFALDNQGRECVTTGWVSRDEFAKYRNDPTNGWALDKDAYVDTADYKSLQPAELWVYLQGILPNIRCDSTHVDEHQPFVNSC
jgi:hypothetical protein